MVIEIHLTTNSRNRTIKTNESFPKLAGLELRTKLKLPNGVLEPAGHPDRGTYEGPQPPGLRDGPATE